MKATAEAAQTYDSRKAVLYIQRWGIASLVAAVIAVTSGIAMLNTATIHDDAAANWFIGTFIATLISMMATSFCLAQRSHIKRSRKVIEAYIASSPEQRGFDVIDDTRPFWRGIVSNTPEWDAIAQEMTTRTALGSELTGMLCREWLRCPATFASVQPGPKFSQLEERGEYFGMRMHAKYMLHHKLLESSSA